MNEFIGEVRLFPYRKIPQDWLICQGQELYIAECPKLYMLIGTTFGGDGKVKFKLPDLRGESPDGMLYCIATDGEFPNVWS